MHSAQFNGVQFNYNGDYSGDIHVTNQGGEETKQTFSNLSGLALMEDAGGPYIEAVRSFVGTALIHEAICNLEQMDPKDIFNHDWLRALLLVAETPK